MNAFVGSFVRHGLSAFGGVLLTFGLSEELVTPFLSATQEVVLGAANIGVALVLSKFFKK